MLIDQIYQLRHRILSIISRIALTCFHTAHIKYRIRDKSSLSNRFLICTKITQQRSDNLPISHLTLHLIQVGYIHSILDMTRFFYNHLSRIACFSIGRTAIAFATNKQCQRKQKWQYDFKIIMHYEL